MPKVPEYKTGVYCIFNTANNKRYIGSAAKSLIKRLIAHRYELRKGIHFNQHLQRAWDLYGENAFEITVIERCAPANCIKREQYWLDMFKVTDPKFGYNNSPTAGSPLGFKHTEETRMKLSKASKGKKKSAEHAANIRAGKAVTKESTKLKMSEYAKNRTKEHTEKLSKAMKGKQNCKGRIMSEETRRKIAEKTKARWDKWKADGTAVEIGKAISKGREDAKSKRDIG